MSKFFLRALIIITLGSASVAQAQAAESVTFTVTITNISNNNTLKLPDGKTTSAPIAPGVFSVSQQADALFGRGKKASDYLERLAEDGNIDPFLSELPAKKNLSASGMFVPGQAFTFTAKPGDRLDFAAMFVQSNDWFFAPQNGGIALFDPSGKPISGDISKQVELYDAGTEVSQAPGSGSDQAPRQSKPNTGASEQSPVLSVEKRKEGFTYPALSELIMVTISAQ